MAKFVCEVCDFVYDEEREGVPFAELGEDWVCPVCGTPRKHYRPLEEDTEKGAPAAVSETESLPDAEKYLRDSDQYETWMSDIHRMAESGESIIEPMRTLNPGFSWDQILIQGAQLARIPLNHEDPVSTRTVIGPNARKPLILDTPLFVTHMSYGALSAEAKLALARGSAAVGTAVCSGEGGILPAEMEAAHRYIFEYVANKYSVSEENLRRADAIEIKIGQSAKPGMGGHLPGKKVTAEIAAVRGRRPGEDIISPSHFPDITSAEELKTAVRRLREMSDGRPIGIKLAAGNIEEDLEVVIRSEPDFVTIDGRAGATGAAPKLIKFATSVPSIFALYRARRALHNHGAEHISLIITGGLRVSPDFAKAIALGADAIALGTAALMACGCQQYRICDSGNCPMGITTQNPELRKRLDPDAAAERLANFLRISTEELKTFARISGNHDVHSLSVKDLCTTSSEISEHTSIRHC